MQLINYFKEALKPLVNKDNAKKFKFSHLKQLIPYMSTQRKKILIGSFFMIILSVSAMPFPYLMKYIIDNVFPEKNINLLNLIIVAIFSIQLLKLSISFMASYFFNVLTQEIMVSIKKDLFYRILRLPLNFFDKNQSGYLLSRIGEVEGLRIFYSSSLITLLIGFFEFIFSLVILFYLHWKLTIISVSILPLFYFATKLCTKGLRRFSREVMEKGALLSRQIQESLSGIDVVKVFSAEERETQKINFCLNNFKNVGIKQNIISTFSSEVLSLVGILGGLILLWYGGRQIIEGNFTIGGYIAFSGYLAKLYGPTHNLATIGLSLQPAITALDRISEFFDLTGEDADKTEKTELSKIERIAFNNVSFSYGKREVLKNINFSIEKGEKILIKGPNGSGKSTIIKLILGLYQVDHGNISIDDHCIEKISLPSIRKRISIVSQNEFLFNDTILNNIAYSQAETKISDIEKALKLSGANTFVNKLGKGINTSIGELGRKLSAGERQKISIARAILKDSDAIILDEATSNLDSESEKRIENLLENEFKQKICIIISHRMWDLNKIDKFFILEEGKIKEIKNQEG